MESFGLLQEPFQEVSRPIPFTESADYHLIHTRIPYLMGYEMGVILAKFLRIMITIDNPQYGNLEEQLIFHEEQDDCIVKNARASCTAAKLMLNQSQYDQTLVVQNIPKIGRFVFGPLCVNMFRWVSPLLIIRGTASLGSKPRLWPLISHNCFVLWDYT